MNPLPMDIPKNPDPLVPENDPAESNEVPSVEEGHLPPPEECHAVLVVDDEALVREVLTKELTQAGYKVITAIDAQEALRKIYLASDWGPTGFPDLIITDIMMPGMDGFEFCQRVKSNPKLKPIPFLFLTVKDTTLDRARALILGCQRYIIKPFTHKELLQAVNERLVDARQTQTLLAEHEQTFEGELARFTVLSLVDLFLIGGWAGTLTIFAQGKQGGVEFASGEVAKVWWDDKEGEEALADLLAQAEGTFKVERNPVPPQSSPS